MSNVPSLRESQANIATLLTRCKPAFRDALPKALDPERFARIALTTIKQNSDLLQCSQNSLLGALMEAAQLGLEIDTRGLAYLLPYKTKNGPVAQLIVGYKGLVDLAYRSGRIRNIYAEVVYESDEFEVTYGTERKITHNFNHLEPRTGKIIASYAVANFKDGSTHFEVALPQEWEKRMKVSPAGRKGYGPWADWQEEMIKKTAIRKLCKLLPLSPEVQQAVAVDEMAEAGKQDLSYRAAEALDVDEFEIIETKTDRLKESLGVVEEEIENENEKETD